MNKVRHLQHSYGMRMLCPSSPRTCRNTLLKWFRSLGWQKTSWGKIVPQTPSWSADQLVNWISWGRVSGCHSWCKKRGTK